MGEAPTCPGTYNIAELTITKKPHDMRFSCLSTHTARLESKCTCMIGGTRSSTASAAETACAALTTSTDGASGPMNRWSERAPVVNIRESRLVDTDLVRTPIKGCESHGDPASTTGPSADAIFAPRVSFTGFTSARVLQAHG